MPSEIETTIYLDLFMFLRSFKLLIASWLALLLLVACGGGGSSASAPSGLTAKAMESSVTLSWDMTPGVEYWVFYGPTSIVPTTVSSMSGWFGIPSGGVRMNVTSPYVVTGLYNGYSYSFSVNGRTGGGPGGPGATPVAVTPKLAGSTWDLGTAVGSNDLRSVTFGSVYVAGGANGAMYSSADGISWNTIASPTKTNLNGAVYSGTYTLVGDGGLVLTSSDAATWTAPTSATSENLNAIASNHVNLNVAVGANGTIVTTSDGVTWTAATSVSPSTTNSFYGVSYSAYSGLWVAVGAAGTVYKSTDGLTWTSVTSPTSADLHGITTVAGMFVAVGSAVGSSGTILSSTDGVTWATLTAPAAIDLKAVTYGTQFVAVGFGGNVFISADGATWTASAATGTTNTLNAVVRGPSAYAAVGAAGTNLLAR